MKACSFSDPLPGIVQQIELWDIGAETQTATLYGHGDQVSTLAFSPDGTTFASGSADGTILLWDTQLVLPHPRTLTKLSGDKQQGLPGSTLPQPFVKFPCWIRTGTRFPGRPSRSRSPRAEGFPVGNHRTTDANGRAAATLTLGSDPGRNTVA